MDIYGTDLVLRFKYIVSSETEFKIYTYSPRTYSKTVKPSKCLWAKLCRETKQTHHAASVSLSHRVGVAKGEAGALCGGGLTEGLEEAGRLWLRSLTKQTARGCTEPASGCS